MNVQTSSTHMLCTDYLSTYCPSRAATSQPRCKHILWGECSVWSVHCVENISRRLPVCSDVAPPEPAIDRRELIKPTQGCLTMQGSMAYLAAFAVVSVNLWHRCVGTSGHCRGEGSPPGKAALFLINGCHQVGFWEGYLLVPKPGNKLQLDVYCQLPEKRRKGQSF